MQRRVIIAAFATFAAVALVIPERSALAHHSNSAYQVDEIITLTGTKVLVSVEGKQVTTFDSASKDLPAEREWYEPLREPQRPTVGYLGLQTHDPGDVVWFKEVNVRKLAKEP